MPNFEYTWGSVPWNRADDILTAVRQYITGPYEAVTPVTRRFDRTPALEPDKWQLLPDPVPRPRNGESMRDYMNRVLAPGWGPPSKLDELAKDGIGAIAGAFGLGWAASALYSADVTPTGDGDIRITWTKKDKAPSLRHITTTAEGVHRAKTVTTTRSTASGAGALAMVAGGALVLFFLSRR